MALLFVLQWILFFLQCGRWENIQGQVEELAYQRQDESPWESVMGLLVRLLFCLISSRCFNTKFSFPATHITSPISPHILDISASYQ